MAFDKSNIGKNCYINLSPEVSTEDSALGTIIGYYNDNAEEYYFVSIVTDGKVIKVYDSDEVNIIEENPVTPESVVNATSQMDAQQKEDTKTNLGVVDCSAENIVSATQQMTPTQAEETRQNIGADTPATVTEWLNNHVNPETGYVIDDTLTIQGAAADAKATGDAIGFVKSYVVNEENVTLPKTIVSKCKVDFTSAGSKLIYGTENVAQLLNLAQGTFTPNGLTITVTGNTISVSGTTTKAFNFSLADGEEKTATELGQMTLPLPNHLYTLSTKATAGSTPYPGLLVRSKSSGNIVTSQNNTAQFTMDDSTCGGIYLYFANNTAYSFTYVLAVLPFTTNVLPYRTQDSNVTVLTDSGLYDIDGYAWAVGNCDVVSITSQINKPPVCKYSTREVSYSNMIECLDIYIPTTNGYINYVFGHCRSVTGYSDVWRIVQIDAVDDSFGLLYHITQLGETEMAIMISGRDDFIGGVTHGDEIMVVNQDYSSFVVLLNGKFVDVTTLTSLTEFDSLQIFLVSDMLDPADHTTKVGVHGREWRFDETGLLLQQTVEFLENLTLDNSYMPMLCAIRGNDSVSTDQITDTYIDDGNFQNYDVATGGFTTYPNQLKKDVQNIHLFGKISGIDIVLDILEQPSGLNGEGTFLFNGVNTYNKIYCCMCGYNHNTQNVSVGDKWKVKTKIQITRKS